MQKIIDVHSHPVVDFGDGTDAGIGLPMQTMPDWSVSQLIEYMDEHDVAMTMLSMSNAACRIPDRAEAAGQARRSNEFLAGLVADHPDRLGAYAVLPGRSMDDSIAELAYALDELHLDAASFSTSVDGVHLGQPRFDPLLAELDRRHATLFVHPVEPDAAKAVDAGLHDSMLEFVFDTTRMITTMVLSGARRRFPDVNVIATHGGGTIPYLVRRVQVLEDTFGPGPEDHSGPARRKLSQDEVLEGLRSFHFDLTAATTVQQLAGVFQLLPPERLMMGFDHPFMPKSTYRESIDDLQTARTLDDQQRATIANGTAARLFPAAAARAQL